MSALNHTPSPWRTGAHGTVVCHQQHEGNHVMRPAHDYGEGAVSPSDLEFYGGYMLAESIARVGDQELIALAPTAPHECEVPECPGAAIKRRLDRCDQLCALLIPLKRDATENVVDVLRRLLSELIAATHHARGRELRLRLEGLDIPEFGSEGR